MSQSFPSRVFEDVLQDYCRMIQRTRLERKRTPRRPSARTYMAALRTSVMSLYEVSDKGPGGSGWWCSSPDLLLGLRNSASVPLPVGETGGCKRKGASRGTGWQGATEAGRKPLEARQGAEPQAWQSQVIGRVGGQRLSCARDRHPKGRDAAWRLGGPSRAWSRRFAGRAPR
jgi:hypothetical protein